MPVERLKVGNPGELIALVPAAIGFYPSDSLVLLIMREHPATGTAVLWTVARHDLLVPWDRLVDAIARAATLAIEEQAVGMQVVIVDSTSDEVTSRTRDSRHDQLVHALHSALAHHAIPLEGAWATTTIAQDSPWWSLRGTDRTGMIPDPENSPLARAHRARDSEHTILPSRQHLADQLRPDPVLARQIRELLPAATTTGSPGIPGEASDQPAAESHRAVIAAVIEQIDAVAAGAEPTLSDYVHAAAALREETVRDCLFGLATTDRAEPAKKYWMLLTRALPDPERAEAATLLTLSAYLDGHGSLAILAAAAAKQSRPDHVIANLLGVALHADMNPQHIRSLADAAHRRAAEIGIDLHQ